MNRTVIILVVFVNLSCEKALAQIDFINEIEKNQFQVMGVNSLGMVGARSWYSPLQDGEETNVNIYGEFTLSMIHKDGGQEWVRSELLKPPYTCPSRYNDECSDYNVEIAAHRLLVEDKAKLTEFAKWVFFIDKQYLEPFTEEAEGGMVTTYFPEENSTFQVVLYQQLPGETIWTEIDRKMINDDEYLEWKSNFKKVKAKEYN